jgi:hypothetical protein
MGGHVDSVVQSARIGSAETPSARSAEWRLRQERIQRAFYVWDMAKTLHDVPTQLTARKVIDDVLAHHEPRIEDLEKLEHYIV